MHSLQSAGHGPGHLAQRACPTARSRLEAIIPAGPAWHGDAGTADGWSRWQYDEFGRL